MPLEPSLPTPTQRHVVVISSNCKPFNLHLSSAGAHLPHCRCAGQTGGHIFTSHVPQPLRLNQARPEPASHSAGSRKATPNRTAAIHTPHRTPRQRFPTRMLLACGLLLHACDWQSESVHDPRPSGRWQARACSSRRDGWPSHSVVAASWSVVVWPLQGARVLPPCRDGERPVTGCDRLGHRGGDARSCECRQGVGHVSVPLPRIHNGIRGGCNNIRHSLYGCRE